jgi:hypothetical protein
MRANHGVGSLEPSYLGVMVLVMRVGALYGVQTPRVTLNDMSNLLLGVRLLL